MILWDWVPSREQPMILWDWEPRKEQPTILWDWGPSREQPILHWVSVQNMGLFFLRWHEESIIRRYPMYWWSVMKQEEGLCVGKRELPIRHFNSSPHHVKTLLIPVVTSVRAIRGEGPWWYTNVRDYFLQYVDVIDVCISIAAQFRCQRVQIE